MDRQNKIQTILEAEKRFSARKIDVPGKGKALLALRQGKGISDQKIDMLYGRVLELLSGEIEKEMNHPDSRLIDQDVVIEKSITTSITESEVIDKKSITMLLDKIESLEKEVVRLRERVDVLERGKEKVIDLSITESQKPIETIKTVIDKSITKETKVIDESITIRPLGYTLYQDKKGNWYANKKESGKSQCIYVGKDVTKAEEKIRETKIGSLKGR